MRKRFRDNYYLWGIYEGMFMIFHLNYIWELNDEEINSLLYSYWIVKRDENGRR